MPTTDEGKKRMVKEVEYMTKTLNCLDGVQPWHFTAMKVLERELDIEEEEELDPCDDGAAQSDGESDEKKETDANECASAHPRVENLTSSSCESSNNDPLPDMSPTSDETHSNGEERIDDIQSNGNENDTPIEMSPSLDKVPPAIAPDADPSYQAEDVTDQVSSENVLPVQNNSSIAEQEVNTLDSEQPVVEQTASNDLI
jgi:hypothetical protein